MDRELSEAERLPALEMRRTQRRSDGRQHGCEKIERMTEKGIGETSREKQLRTQCANVYEAVNEVPYRWKVLRTDLFVRVA